ncbi:nitrite reductase [Nocardioides panacisoli]|uniref:Nitrite/Sulfite reductase ferredoxin-like domain-containing protein n=1 Tax=Nocardioides panacisoli TaxID=627624 RepID=A0ABP7INS4_9ACTN
MSATLSGTARTRPDRCPGVLRPWPADDGALVRVRVPGGRVPTPALVALTRVAEAYGDRRVRVTARANLQLRGLPLSSGSLPAEVVAAIEATGLLPSRSHDLARNILCSPQTGRAGGLADLRPVLAALDAAICASPLLAGLPGRFLFTLDDGRGDVLGRHRDLGLVARGAGTARLVVGRGWGPEVRLEAAVGVLVGLAEEFLAARGTGPNAAWHVDELPTPLIRGSVEVDSKVSRRPFELPYGEVPGGEHVAVGEDGISLGLARGWAERTAEVVVTPWHGVLL